VGFTGSACEIDTTSFVSHNNLPAASVVAYGSSFVGSVMQLESEKGKAPDFNFIVAKANEQVVFALGGNGQVSASAASVSGNLLVQSATVACGMVVLSGGLTVDKDGMSIAGGGLDVLGNQVVLTSDTPNSVLSVTGTNTVLRNEVMRVTGPAGATPALYRLFDL